MAKDSASQIETLKKLPVLKTEMLNWWSHGQGIGQRECGVTAFLPHKWLIHTEILSAIIILQFSRDDFKVQTVAIVWLP